jgi:DNA-binding response OmpR family regulator
MGRILFVDDEEIFLLSTADLLRAEGYQVDCCGDALEARRQLEAQTYDVLISDIRMPGNADLGLLRSLPSNNAGLPVILVTGYPSAQTAIQAIDLNVLTYLVKPLEFQELLDRVRDAVGQRTVQRAVQASSARVQKWAAEMSEMASSIGAVRSGCALSVHELLGMTLGRMGETLLDLKHLVDMTSPGSGEEPGLCPIQRCPRLKMYEGVIREGIETLERTKGAFKSKELGDLRHRLEQTVGSETFDT